MAVLKVLIAPHPILSTVTASVESVDYFIKQQLKDMAETMYADNGIGLAANQVGISKRMLVMDVGEDNSIDRNKTDPIGPKLYCIINPVVVWASEEKVTMEEGCLSVPGQSVPIERPESVKIKYLDESGIEKTETFVGLQARCIWHEMDHLDGKTMLEYLSKLKKDLAIKKLTKHYYDR
jgi:peptide deformylase